MCIGAKGAPLVATLVCEATLICRLEGRPKTLSLVLSLQATAITRKPFLSEHKEPSVSQAGSSWWCILGAIQGPIRERTDRQQPGETSLCAPRRSSARLQGLPPSQSGWGGTDNEGPTLLHLQTGPGPICVAGRFPLVQVDYWSNPRPLRKLPRRQKVNLILSK